MSVDWSTKTRFPQKKKSLRDTFNSGKTLKKHFLSGTSLSSFWKLLSFSVRPLIATPCWVRNCKQCSFSIIPSLLSPAQWALVWQDEYLLVFDWSKHTFLETLFVKLTLFMAVQKAWALSSVIYSSLHKAIISTFGESCKLFDSSKSALFTKSSLIVFQRINHPLFLYFLLGQTI